MPVINPDGSLPGARARARFADRSPTTSPSHPSFLGMSEAEFQAKLAATPDRDPVAPIGEPLGEVAARHSLPKTPPPIRSTRKAAQWREGLHRAYHNIAARIPGPWRQAELDALFERAVEEGPDFLKVRANADFAPAPVVAYNRDAAAEIMRQFRQIERESYGNREKGKHGGVLGRAAGHVLEWLAFVQWPKSGRFGMVPSLAHIADGARMSRATVVEALKTLERFGFLTIHRRRQRIQTPFGPKVVQATNAYVLHLARGLGALALTVLARTPRPSPVKSPPPESSQSPAMKIHSSSLEQASRKVEFSRHIVPIYRIL